MREKVLCFHLSANPPPPKTPPTRMLLSRRPQLQRQPFRMVTRNFLPGLVNMASAQRKRAEQWQRVLSVPRRVVYNVVADVDSYSDFLPWCVSSRVTKRQPGPAGTEILETNIAVGFSLKSAQFTSTVTLTPLQRVHAVCAKSEHLEELSFSWDFFPIGERACRLDLKLGTSTPM